jgi:hypothetical protein
MKKKCRSKKSELLELKNSHVRISFIEQSSQEDHGCSVGYDIFNVLRDRYEIWDVLGNENKNLLCILDYEAMKSWKRLLAFLPLKWRQYAPPKH